MIDNRLLTNDTNWEIRIRIIFGIAFLAFAILITDIVFDYFEWYNSLHYVIEVTPLISLTVLLVYLLRLLLQVRIDATSWQKRANRAEKDVERWKWEIKEIAKGLSHAIDEQFKNWNFTKAEKEIGILILKGMSFKEIAQIRTTSERTVRQQTLVIYKKSIVGGRAEFSAFFLEDLLFPLDIPLN
jgi:DNA-binding CsgD family transcriptional regulator